MILRGGSPIGALFAMLCCLMLVGCGLWAEPVPPVEDIAAQAREAEIARKAEAEKLQNESVPYSVRIVVEGLVPPDPAEVAALEKLMTDNSGLVRLLNDPPDSDLGLERRYLDDEATALKVLHSQGYYEGRAFCELDWKTRPTVPVILKLVPGRRFTVGKTRVTYTAPDTLPPDGRKAVDAAPANLDSFGILPGVPAVAETLVAASAKVPETLTSRGFPFAEGRPVYRLFPQELHLNADVGVKTGPFVRFGEVELTGAENVEVEYLQRLVPWAPGTPWSARRLDFYRDTLQQTGLFREVRVEPVATPDAKTGAFAPGTLGPDNALPVRITAREAEFKKISGSLRYSTDRGFGVQGVWEHKNLFNAGEKLRLALTLSNDLKETSAVFTKPAFGQAGQSLVMQAVARDERTNAYDLKALAVEGGLDRYFDWRWWGGARITAQTGTIRENGQDWDRYHLLGLPVSVRYFGANNPLNPTRGFRAQATVTPYTGYYKEYFALVRLQGEVSAYHAPFERPAGRDWDRLVLAGRIAVGAMPGTVGRDVYKVPGALRFYTGGGGSVRGYKYRHIGPKDKFGDPLGGLSMVEANFEARFRLTESLGLVPFIDGGMVYESPLPKLDGKLDWAVGLGFRYFTPIGPVRLDVAFPLQKRGSDPFQVYISIGQSF